MFCCMGSKCLGDEDGSRRGQKGSKLDNQKLFLQQNGQLNPKGFSNQNPGFINMAAELKPEVLRPDVKHVTNAQKDAYVKLSNVLKEQKYSTRNLYDNYRVVLISKPKTVLIPSLRPQRPISKSSPELPKASSIRVEIGKADVEKPAPMSTRDSMRLSTEFNVSNEDNRTSTPFPLTLEEQGGITISDDSVIAIFEAAETESLTEEQRLALEQLDASLNGFEDDDNDMPIIIADVLPLGVISEAYESKSDGNLLSSPAESSEDEPSSVNSRTGIISKKRQSLKIKKIRNSVSFQLPEDYVDKPYSPMQTSSKTKNRTVVITSPAQEQTKPQQTTLRVSGNDVNIWHTQNGVFVENKHQRRLSGPFKGSFKSLFYTKYNTDDLKTYEGHKQYLAPKIMEKVASFENITSDFVLNNYRPNASIIRRNTYR